jgi:N-acyl-D-amino-acid deacylase
VLDIGTQIDHGPLRAYVMGECGAANEPATAADRDAMSELVLSALTAGLFARVSAPTAASSGLQRSAPFTHR